MPRFRDTLPPATGRRADGRSPRAIPTGRKACKTSAGFCTRTASNQKKKSAQSPVFPRFPPARGFLCGKKFASLRQEINFFQQRNPVFAAQKSPPRRRNAPYGQFPRPILCRDAINRVSTVPPHRRGTRRRTLHFDSKSRDLATFRHWRGGGIPQRPSPKMRLIQKLHRADIPGGVLSLYGYRLNGDQHRVLRLFT